MGAKAHSPLAVRERLLLGAYVGRSADREADDHREECLTGNFTDCGTRIGGTDDLAVLLRAASACVTLVYDTRLRNRYANCVPPRRVLRYKAAGWWAAGLWRSW